MALPVPRLVSSQAVFAFAFPSRDPSRDEPFIQSVAPAFPHLVNRQFVPADAAPQTPHLVLASTSSQLAVSAAQADFQVRFYGDYVADIERALDYIRGKLGYVLAACERVNLPVTALGLVLTLQFPLDGGQDAAVKHIRNVHLRAAVDTADLQDVVVRIALRLRDTYYLNITLGQFESRVLDRPIAPGFAPARISPWEGRVVDGGLEMTIDINNVLEAKVSAADPKVTSVALDAVLNTMRHVAEISGPRFLETGEISTAEIVDSSQVTA
jgi:hypothetical protein